MLNQTKIAVDAMGGEGAPKKTIDGIIKHYQKDKNVVYNIFGNQDEIKAILPNNFDKETFRLFHTTDKILETDTALTAAKRGKNTSMWKAIESVKKGESDIIISAGNTGALFVIAKLNLKMIENIDKPALSALWPNKKGMNIVLDLGANIECDEKNIIEFSEMGSALHKSLFPKEKTKVALLNVGSEEIKGTEIIKKAHSKLKEISKNENFEFDGYIEGNKITDGKSNVIVTDGFTGNIALKTAEGTAKFITDNLKISLKENFLSKFSLIFSYFSLKKFKEKLDPRKFNGAIFLGLNGPVVKSHGSTDSIGFYHSIDLCYNIVKGNLMKQIKDNLSHLNDS